MRLVSKVILGTANFGLEYGIDFGKRVPDEEIRHILQLAENTSIFGIDTARAYGKAESIVGKFLNSKSKLKIISKLKKGKYKTADEIISQIKESLLALNIQKIDYYLIHSFETFRSQTNVVVEALKKAKKDGLINNFGISVYYPYEVEYFKTYFKESITIEFPLNVFDRRFLKYIPQWKKDNYTLFARSVFLQGLFFLDKNSLEEKFPKVKDKILQLRQITHNLGTSLNCLLLWFVASFESLDGFIIGVNNVKQLEENLDCLEKYLDIRDLLKNFETEDEDIIIPSRWKL